VIVAALSVLAVVSPGFAGHTGSTRFPNPDPNPRIGTPDDPGFDCAEPDDEDVVTPCTQVWSEQHNLFGFPPASTEATATYHDPARAGQGQISGVSADRAWKITTGDDEIAIAIIDTGIEWSNSELRLKIWLNEGELPLPQLAGGGTAPSYDANGDGLFNVADYNNDSRVNSAAGPNGNPGVVDGQDLLAAFSNGADNDANAYVDDIVGWDFFDDDNDPYDASSYSAADGHGTGRAEQAAAQTDNGSGDAGVCPDCQIMPLRLWDTFVAPADTYAMATLYAADNGADVQEVALGVLQNSKFAQAATAYAFKKGVALMQVSSDLNTANHNYPTNYNNTVFVAGTVADSHGLGQDFGEQSEEFAQFLSLFGIGTQAPVGTWFRNSGLTQFGGHAAIVMVGDTGSTATGQAAGAAGLIKSRALEVLGDPLTSNEVKQIITLTAEDVLPENTVGEGIPDHAQPGWDQHFGYGRADLDDAVARVAPDAIPPEAGIESPPWFMPLDPVTNPDVPMGGFAAANRASSYTYTLEYAPGLEPLEETFTQFGTGSGTEPLNGTLGTLPLDDVAALLPGAAQGVPPVDPHQYAFTVRLQVTDNFGNIGEDRKVLFAYHDPTMHAGWPKFVDSGGEQSLRMADLDGDGALEIIAANTSGEIHVYNHDGTPASYFNGGAPFEGPVLPLVQNHIAAPAFASGGVPPSRGGYSTPAVGDLDRDGSPEIVAVNGDRVYALRWDGSVLPGFSVAINPAFSAPNLRTKTNHLKTAIFSSAVLADLDQDERLDIIVSAMDQRAYAWNMDGDLLPGWPVFLQSPASPPGGDDEPGAESINTPAVADITGDGVPEVVVATNELYSSAGVPGSIEEAVRQGLINLAAGNVGVSSRLYAIHADGTAHDGDPADDGGWLRDPDAFLTGWPVTMNGLAALLPLVGPGVDAIIADVDPTATGPEVLNGGFAGEWLAIDDNGTPRYGYQSAASGGPSLSPGTIVQTAEHPAVGDVTGTGTLSMFKGGLPVEQVVNLLLVGQNIPFQHVIQGWNAATGSYLPGWPRAIDDYQLFMSPAIADIGGGPGREVIQGSGLYLLHAFGPLGTEAPGFPKFTGGWITTTAPVGDIDNDGQLEIATWTREGNMFVYDTTGPACGGNNEWWGFRHDEHNSGYYGNDTRPPSAILDLTHSNGALRWSAPGEDHRCGQATRYEIRRSTSPITRENFDQATLLAGAPTPAAVGTQQTFAVTVGLESQFYAVQTFDDAGNPGPISNVVLIDGTDEDADGVLDIDELNCGGNHLNASIRPERLDGSHAGVDDDSDTQVDEPLPASAIAFDCDGDGYTGAVEYHIYSPSGTGNQRACGTNSFPPTNPPSAIGWPSDLRGETTFSANRVNIVDLGTFVNPIRRINTDVGTTGGDRRWDIIPGAGVFPADINIADMAALITNRTAYPPMLKGARAFNGPVCPP
jgi:hypothetical protein